MSLLFHKQHHSNKHSVLQIPLPNETIDKFFLLEVLVHIILPQYVTDVMKFVAALLHCTVHKVDVCPYKMAS